MTEINKGGRPTKYTTEVCQKVLEFGEKGYHVAEMANALNVAVRTIYGWADVYPEFAEAFERAKQASLCYWFKLGEDNLNSKFFNERTYQLLIRNKCNIGCERRITIKGLSIGSHLERTTTIFKAIENGELTADEAAKYMDIIDKAARIDEVTELRKAVERFEEEEKRRNPPGLRAFG